MTVTYDPRSPYAHTLQVNKYVSYLDFWTARIIPSASDDLIISLDTKYNNRPDLLSYDLYGTPQLWWIFAVRNPNVIKDPVYDFKSGTVIYAPSSNTIGAYI